MRCCVELKTTLRVINLLDTSNLLNRIIRVYECPKCNCIKAQLQQYNKQKGIYEYDSPKRKKLAEWLRVYENQPYTENIINFKAGTKSNMYWVYSKNGNTYDFNDTRILN
jgi:hypothetical protein